ncbi:MAG: hypothetical protein AAF577_01765 [Pseudomonadota bacterium]
MSWFLQSARCLSAVLGLAIAMLAWSEFVFFNEEPAALLVRTLKQGLMPTLIFVGEMILFYAIPGSFLLGLLAGFGSEGAARIMLIGALTGYAIEAAVVPAAYEAVPVSYLWTAIAWHGPVTVGVGVFLLPRLLGHAALSRMAVASLLLGGSWGLWAPWVWEGDESIRLSATGFLTFSIVTIALATAGYGLLLASRWPDLPLPRWVCVTLCLPTLVLLVAQGLAVPIAALGLFVIVAAVFGLLRLQGAGFEPGYGVRWSNLLALPLLPVAASIVYAVQLRTGPLLETADLAGLTALGGLLVWIYGVGRGTIGAMRRRARAASE